MTLTAVVGQAQASDGREAGLQATHQALKKLGIGSPSLAIVVASRYYDSKKNCIQRFQSIRRNSNHWLFICFRSD